LEGICFQFSLWDSQKNSPRRSSRWTRRLSILSMRFSSRTSRRQISPRSSLSILSMRFDSRRAWSRDASGWNLSILSMRFQKNNEARMKVEKENFFQFSLWDSGLRREPWRSRAWTALSILSMRFMIVITIEEPGQPRMPFNSLYEIPPSNSSFRVPAGSAMNFQFSLWDSLYEKTMITLDDLGAFNSLYEILIELMRDLIEWRRMTFNSLYEIQQ